jgi:hypothetical protein
MTLDIDGTRYLQIIPANGWFARVREVGEETGYQDLPLVCWALVKSLEGVEVVGLAAHDEVVPADEWDGFSCYVHESELKHEGTTG